MFRSPPESSSANEAPFDFDAGVGVTLSRIVEIEPSSTGTTLPLRCRIGGVQPNPVPAPVHPKRLTLARIRTSRDRRSRDDGVNMHISVPSSRAGWVSSLNVMEYVPSGMGPLPA